LKLRALLPIALAGALALAMLFAATIGPVPLSAGEVLDGALASLGLKDGIDARVISVVATIRAPRVVLGALVGAALASAGVAMQALFRNPLADAGLLGVSSGGALGSALAIVVFGDAFASVPALAATRPAAAFVGGLVSTMIILSIGRRRGATDVAVMLLAGVAMNALAGSMLGLLSHVADDAQLRDITFWTLGNLGNASWRTVAVTAPPMIVCVVALPLLASKLDVHQLGEAEARHLGVDTDALVRTLVVLAALAVGGTVAAAGLLGFVGLVVPHAVRLVAGGLHRGLTLAAPLLGALLLVVADAVARWVVSPAELPVGVLTAALGAPFFLVLVLRARRAREGPT
jgi:iron complex transport system permease protein